MKDTPRYTDLWMPHTLRGVVPAATGTPVDDPYLLRHVRWSVQIAAREAQCEPITEPVFMCSTTDARCPGVVMYIFECETTEPVCAK